MATGRWADDEHTDGWRHGLIILLYSSILTMRESDVARLVEFRPGV